MINIKANRQYAVNLSGMLRNWRFLGECGGFAINRGGTNEDRMRDTHPFTCLSCLISMLNVPFQAMYTAKQEIAELTIYSFARTTLNVCILYYMVSHPADWLSRYAGLMALLGIVPQVIIGIRAFIKYPEYFD